MAEAVPKTMRALVLTGVNAFEVQDGVPVPEPGPTEVLCRIHSVAICGTDPEIIQGSFKGRWPRAYPFILGHEFSGVVVKAGETAQGFGYRPGDRVAGTSHCGCGYCRMCTTGRYNLCENYGREELGHRQYGHYTNGAYAEYQAFSIKSVFKIPETMTLEEGALVDGASIALHSVKRGRVEPGDAVAVIGPGPLGLLCLLCAQALGAARVLVVGHGDRLQRAKELGAEIVDDARVESTVKAVRELTGGRGADLTVDAAARGATPRQAVEMTRKGGRVVLTGVPLEPVELPLQRVVLEEMDVYGVRANRGTCEEVIPLIANGRINARALVTHVFPLSEFHKAYEIFTKRIDGALKVLVQPNPEPGRRGAGGRLPEA